MMPLARSRSAGPAAGVLFIAGIGAALAQNVAVSALIGGAPIIDNVIFDMVDTPLLMRSAQSTRAWATGEADKAQQEQTQRSNQVKPQL